jgi:hypothetical protein
MLSSVLAAGFWNINVGLVFIWIILLPAVATGLIVVAKISAKGEKAADAELQGRWGRRRGPADPDA